MEKEYIALLAAVISVLISGVFAVFAFYQRIRNEHLKAKSKTLYYLLEIRHTVKMSIIRSSDLQSSLSEFFDEYFRNIGIKFPQDDSSISDMIQVQMSQLVATMSPGISPDLVMKYEKSLDLIAEHDPLTSFQLAGKNLISEVVEHIEGLASDALDEIEFTEKASPRLQTDIRDEVKKHYEKIKTKYLKALDKDILYLARNTSWIYYFRCLCILKKSLKDIEKFELSNEQKKEMKELLDGIYSGIGQILQNETKPNK